MLISLNWLKEFVDLPKNLDPKILATELTIKTAEVDSVHDESKAFENIVVGQIVELKPHPNADKLRIAMTSVGKETLQIVCGGSNLTEGMYVAVAKPGAKVKWHGQGELVTLERTKIRDIESVGMICAGSEIDIDDPHAKEDRHILDLSSIKPKVGTCLSEIFNRNDVIFEFDNKALTHRPDLWGHYGIAREIAAITDAKLKPFKTSVKIPTRGETVAVEVKDTKLCPRYCGMIIENVKIGSSPDWLQKRLKATGHGIHNNIVDVTNYVMTELGQPLHAFDKNYIKKGIIVRRAEKHETITCLDGKIRELDSETLIIADHEKPVAIAGVIGGENSCVNENTTSLILESANFNSTSIRRTSTKFTLRTEAVQRFEKALDPNLAEIAIKRAAELILQICPAAKIAGPITDIKNFSATPIKIPLNPARARSKIGAEISDKQITEILKKLEFEVQTTPSRDLASSKNTKKSSKTTADFFLITVPSFRSAKDIKSEDDLIEEIARIYGYASLPAELPHLPTRLPIENSERFKKHRARELLSYGLGFDEIYNYSFYGKTEIQNCLLKEEGHVKLLNHLSADQTHLRTTLIPNLLKNLQQNIKHTDQVKIYEIGHTYREIGQFMPLEEKQIAGAILVKGKTDDPFCEAKGAVEAFFSRYSIPLPQPAKGIQNTPYAHPSKSLSYVDQNAQTLAKVFMLHPVVSKKHELENYSIGIFTINFSELMKLPTTTRKYRKIPRFPSIEIDISVLINATTEIQTIQNLIAEADKTLVTSVNLFDIYQGPNIPPDKKSVAFKIILQSEDRTLTDVEMTEVQNKIFHNLEKAGCQPRTK